MARRPADFGARAPRPLAGERVCVSALQAARAAYVWRLQSERAAVADQLADLNLAFRLLLLLQDSEETTDLLRARTAYVAEVHAAHPDLDGKVDDLAAVHQHVITAALDQADALSLASTQHSGAPRTGPALSCGVWVR